jgi:hypothetical protein
VVPGDPTRPIKVIPTLDATNRPKSLWGITTNTHILVKAVMLSPNYWDGRTIGNMHYFFMLEGCQNDGSARGFYNEFLKEELTPHRKVIEMVGSKMRTEESTEQLSGLGFSSTQRNQILCRIGGSFSRTVRINF